MALVLLFLAMYSSAHAERLGVGFSVGYMDFKEDFDSVAVPTVSVNYGIDGDTSVELSIGQIAWADTTSIPIQITVQPRLHFGDLSPYIGAGIGYYMNLYKQSGVKGNAFGPHAEVGVDYFISKDISVGLGIRHTAAWGFISAGTPKEKLDFEANIISLGVKYLF